MRAWGGWSERAEREGLYSCSEFQYIFIIGVGYHRFDVHAACISLNLDIMISTAMLYVYRCPLHENASKYVLFV